MSDLYFHKLYEINREWAHYKDFCPKESVHFETDNDAIQAHLLLVCKYLEDNPSQFYNESQLSYRNILIEKLKNYANKKEFPTNSFHLERTPYFVDIHGVHCAVGYLMKESGYTDLVAKIRENENYSYIAEIQTEGVSEWAKKHGFTVDELKWIQPTYGISQNFVKAIGDGTNGPVNKIVENKTSGGIIIAGDFDSLNLEPCLSIGVYDNSQFSCLGGGVTGTINDIFSTQTEIYLFGQFDYQGDVYTMATYDNGSWDYFNIPSREGYIATAGMIRNNRIEVAINHPDTLNKQEIWVESNSNIWYKGLEVNGFIRKVGAFGNRGVFAGWFTEAIAYNDLGVALDTVFTKNVIFKEPYNNNNWTPINGTEISDTVNTFVVTGGQIYFGGSTSNDSTSNNILISRYLNNTFQPIMYTNFLGYEDFYSINAIAIDNENNGLIFGGDFKIQPTIGTSGNNLLSYDVFNHTSSLRAMLNNRVNTIASYSNEIFFGGDFTSNFSVEINHIGKFNKFLSTQNELNDKKTVNVYPNPFTNYIQLENVSSDEKYQIADLHGKMVQSGSLNPGLKIDLSSLSKGTYFLTIERDQQVIHKKIVKN